MKAGYWRGVWIVVIWLGGLFAGAVWQYKKAEPEPPRFAPSGVVVPIEGMTYVRVTYLGDIVRLEGSRDGMTWVVLNVFPTIEPCPEGQICK